MIDERTYTAQTLAPEEIRPGIYLTVLHEILEPPPRWWLSCLAVPTAAERELRMPDGSARPVQVVDACLPFILVRNTRGRHRTIDIRRYRLARVSDRFGRCVFEQASADRAARRKEKEEREEEEKSSSTESDDD